MPGAHGSFFTVGEGEEHSKRFNDSKFREELLAINQKHLIISNGLEIISAGNYEDELDNLQIKSYKTSIQANKYAIASNVTSMINKVGNWIFLGIGLMVGLLKKQIVFVIQEIFNLLSGS